MNDREERNAHDPEEKEEREFDVSGSDFPLPASDAVYQDLDEALGISGNNAPANEPRTEETAALKAEIADLKNQLAASRADLYNYRQRAEREKSRTIRGMVLDRVSEFLPALDNLDRALAVPEDTTAKNVLIGVRMVLRQFLSILEDLGVTLIPAEGQRFDPLLHDAVETEPAGSPEMDGMILAELVRGYRADDRVLRPARVRVARAIPGVPAGDVPAAGA
ncbi:MAG: nucleotide exchange factor GrpE [Synergistaceae bacterium]|jgi:molecular chaperone GrpE|nr:nucleotide exchange factor GrpE [Synergistaceae bacterium]